MLQQSIFQHLLFNVLQSMQPTSSGACQSLESSTGDGLSRQICFVRIWNENVVVRGYGILIPNVIKSALRNISKKRKYQSHEVLKFGLIHTCISNKWNLTLIMQSGLFFSSEEGNGVERSQLQSFTC